VTSRRIGLLARAKAKMEEYSTNLGRNGEPKLVVLVFVLERNAG